MLKYKRIIKDKIVQTLTANPAMSVGDIHAEVMVFIQGLEPWDDGDIERYHNYTLEMITNYVKAKRGE